MTPPESQSFQDVLVHYTSDKGLEGILSSNRLWATHSSHTNDGEELQTWTKLLDRFCETRFWETSQFKNSNFPIELLEKGNDEGNAWRRAMELMKDELIEASKRIDLTTYIFSFSEHKKTEKHVQNNGRLSQWRAYGDYGIVFNNADLRHIVDTIPSSFLFNPVEYVDIAEPLKKDGIIYQWFGGLVITNALIEAKERDTPRSEQILQALLPEDFKNDEAHLLFYHAKTIALIKNIGFEEENEYRLAIFNTNIQKYPEEFTIRRHRIVPYIDLFKHAPLNDPLPIEKILIGPAPAGEQVKRKEAVEALLRHLKKDIPVHCSAIPYRG
jgi:hypothetical protein